MEQIRFKKAMREQTPKVYLWASPSVDSFRLASHWLLVHQVSYILTGTSVLIGDAVQARPLTGISIPLFFDEKFIDVDPWFAFLT